MFQTYPGPVWLTDENFDVYGIHFTQALPNSSWDFNKLQAPFLKRHAQKGREGGSIQI